LEKQTDLPAIVIRPPHVCFQAGNGFRVEIFQVRPARAEQIDADGGGQRGGKDDRGKQDLFFIVDSATAGTLRRKDNTGSICGRGRFGSFGIFLPARHTSKFGTGARA
jgi:hypothetical protein